ncbi:MAG: HD domain-containing protein [Chrysiogenales bacterium]|nr:MAG: HD domain-containing protein [Chrysiogenales bacterium]
MRNINLNIRLPDDIRDTVVHIASTFRDRGFQCYLIGGSVRDLALGHNVYDYDFATDARPEEVMKLFRRTIPTGIKHGTVSVLSKGRQFEITTYRSDGEYNDGRRPESVCFSKELHVDVERRDFTINGLVFDPLTGELIDHVGGIEDLRAGRIRTIGDPVMRFSEDGLRPIRACRFAAKLEFIIDPDTLHAITRTLHVVKMVSPERIRDELMKILDTEKPSIGFEYLRESGLLDIILPELAQCHSVTQNKYHIFDIYYHSIYSCDGAPREYPMIRLAALLHDIGKLPTRQPGADGECTFYNHEVVGSKIARRILKRLKFSNEQTDVVINLILNHMFHYTDEWTDGAVRRFIRKVGIENIDDLIILRRADRKGNGARKGLPAPIERLKKRIEHVIEQDNAFSVRDLDINGNILMKELGLTPGPIIGRILNELLEAVLDDPELNTREKLTDMARAIMLRDKNDPPAGD